MPVTVRGVVDSLSAKEPAKKTRRRLEGLMLRGQHIAHVEPSLSEEVLWVVHETAKGMDTSERIKNTKVRSLCSKSKRAICQF